MDDPPLIFERSVRGSCTPLVVNGQLFGVLNVEFPPNDPRDLIAEDRVVIRVADPEHPLIAAERTHRLPHLILEGSAYLDYGYLKPVGTLVTPLFGLRGGYVF